MKKNLPCHLLFFYYIPVKYRNVYEHITGTYIHSFDEISLSCNKKNVYGSVINQDGRAGLFSARPGFEFACFPGKKSVNTQTISVSQKTGG